MASNQLQTRRSVNAEVGNLTQAANLVHQSVRPGFVIKGVAAGTLAAISTLTFWDLDTHGSRSYAAPKSTVQPQLGYDLMEVGEIEAGTVIVDENGKEHLFDCDI